MTPKEKAKELVNKFLLNAMTYEMAKQCAIICVDEIINHIDKCGYSGYEYDLPPEIFWNEVKQEIEKL